MVASSELQARIMQLRGRDRMRLQCSRGCGTKVPMKTIQLPSGERVPALGQGTWYMGESREAREEEIATLRLGIDLGATLIDTAEMYGDGKAEEVIAAAIDGVRER